MNTDFVCWLPECIDVEPTKVTAKNHEQAAVLAMLRMLATWNHHENVPDGDPIWVADFETGETQLIYVKIIHEAWSAFGGPSVADSSSPEVLP